MRKYREACLFLTCTSCLPSREFKDVYSQVRTITAVWNAIFLFIFSFFFLSRLLSYPANLEKGFYQFFQNFYFWLYKINCKTSQICLSLINLLYLKLIIYKYSVISNNIFYRVLKYSLSVQNYAHFYDL